MKRIAIKIGSNVLARRDGTLDITRMSALVDQVVSLRRAAACQKEDFFPAGAWTPAGARIKREYLKRE